MCTFHTKVNIQCELPDADGISLWQFLFLMFIRWQSDVYVYLDPKLISRARQLADSHGIRDAKQLAHRKNQLQQEFYSCNTHAFSITLSLQDSFFANSNSATGSPINPSLVLYLLEIINGLVIPARHFVDDRSLDFQVFYMSLCKSYFYLQFSSNSISALGKFLLSFFWCSCLQT